MTDPLTVTAALIGELASRVKHVKTNESGCRLLADLAKQTLTILKQLEGRHFEGSVTTALDLLNDALTEAKDAVNKCCKTNFVYAMIYHESYALALKHAAEKLEHALSQISLATVGMAADMQSDLVDLSTQIRKARFEERASAAHQTIALKGWLEKLLIQLAQGIKEEVTRVLSEVLSRQSIAREGSSNSIVHPRHEKRKASKTKEEKDESGLLTNNTRFPETLADAGYLFVHEIMSDPRIVGSPRTKGSESQLQPGIYEAHGNFSFGSMRVYASQLLIIEPNGSVVGYTLYQSNRMDLENKNRMTGAGKYDGETRELTLRDNRYDYHGHIKVLARYDQVKLEWNGKVSKVEASNEECHLALACYPPRAFRYPLQPTMLRMKGRDISTTGTTKYRSKIVLSLNVDYSVCGWVYFASITEEFKVMGRIIEGLWDDSGSLTFLIRFSLEAFSAKTDSRLANHVDVFKVHGSFGDDEGSGDPTFMSVIAKTMNQGMLQKDRRKLIPITDLKCWEYTFIYEATIPWCCQYITVSCSMLSGTGVVICLLGIIIAVSYDKEMVKEQLNVALTETSSCASCVCCTR